MINKHVADFSWIEYHTCCYLNSKGEKGVHSEPIVVWKPNNPYWISYIVIPQ